ncbi:cysteine protease ATG4B-like isoform X3 [Ornithodoros turicata]|uniref:cysteine protease ATG4B-like isoform X3 n=1 Tax=Ornithodoros turicata TaxID=34597 RepID=UPI0031393711
MFSMRRTDENVPKPCLSYEPGIVEYEDFQPSAEPVFILGTKYSTLHDLEELRSDVKSRIWLTYRKNFPAIGGTGPTSDSGWGCMLRCGQMVLAQALIRRHLGRGWRWNPESSRNDREYMDILRMFQDKKKCPYSIHQIAQMGVSEGKAVGEWFGPNTVAQALRKLAMFDNRGSLAVHVAMDNTVIISEIKDVCKLKSVSAAVPPAEEPLRKRPSCSARSDEPPQWQPLLLFIPLRLGLSEINPIYFSGIKKTFAMKQSLGFIGGKPNHALYFIGVSGDELVFLDPHTTQLVCDLDEECCTDETYHCPYASRMDIGQLDPSVALCFFFATETDFDCWCTSAHKHLVDKVKQPLFEVTNRRPPGWPPLEEQRKDLECASLEFTVLDRDRKFDNSDDEFEIL